jgi:hypothetical protein
MKLGGREVKGSKQRSNNHSVGVMMGDGTDTKPDVMSGVTTESHLAEIVEPEVMSDVTTESIGTFVDLCPSW